ncbi:hypothetical protein H5410_029837 [Solanum commersonii]|uniref:Uncharacterized protein n=1 Tax=Solanum commersonii TaxID=4109 RepID=A0A9J5YCL3_SOLCO|nr:hypothetical protein H5410_029837 [Solanum commersonii]
MASFMKEIAGRGFSFDALQLVLQGDLLDADTNSRLRQESHRTGKIIQATEVGNFMTEELDCKTFLYDDVKFVCVGCRTSSSWSHEKLKYESDAIGDSFLAHFSLSQSLHLLSKGYVLSVLRLIHFYCCKAENPGKLLLEWPVPYPFVLPE